MRPATTIGLALVIGACQLLVACGAPAESKPHKRTLNLPASAVAAAPAEDRSPADGITCGAQRCTAERPHCCYPMGDVADTAEPLPEPTCVADHTQCSGVALAP